MRSRWLTERAMGFHLLVVCMVSGCLLAGRWQLSSALGGNTLSWAYVVEWPVFAVIAVVAWWHLIHEDPAERAEKAVRAAELHHRAAAFESATDQPRSWRDAAIGAYDWDELSQADAARVATAARLEYEAHVARLAERNEAEAGHRTRGRSADR